MLLLTLGRPSRVDVRQVVVGRQPLRLEHAGRPQARERPPIKLRTGCHDERFVLRDGHDPLPPDEGGKVIELTLDHAQQLVGARMASLDLLPRLGRVAVCTRRDLLELLLRRLELCLCDFQQPLDRHLDAFFEPQLLGEPLRTQSKRGPRAWCDGVAQVRQIAPQRVDRHGGCVGKIAEQVHVLQVAKRLRKIALDKGQHPFERFDTDLGKKARWVGDVLPRGFEESRHLTQLGHDPPRPVGDRGVREEHLAGKAGCQCLRVVERVPLPGPFFLEREQPGLYAPRQHPPFELLVSRQATRIDTVETPGPAAELTQLGVDRRSAQVFQQVVMQVDAIEGRGGRMRLVQVGQVLVDETSQWLRRGWRRSLHGVRRMVQYRGIGSVPAACGITPPLNTNARSVEPRGIPGRHALPHSDAYRQSRGRDPARSPTPARSHAHCSRGHPPYRKAPASLRDPDPDHQFPRTQREKEGPAADRQTRAGRHPGSCHRRGDPLAVGSGGPPGQGRPIPRGSRCTRSPARARYSPHS